MKNIVIFINACRYNRGSEALVRGLVKSLKHYITDSNIILCSKDVEKDMELNISGIDRYINRYSYNRKNKIIRYLLSGIRYIFHMPYLADRLSFIPAIHECKTADLIIMIGADNYDKAYGGFRDMHSFNKTLHRIKKTNTKMVLYDCSLHPDEFSKEIAEDFNLFNLVTVRDNITYNGIIGKASVNLVKFLPDPAFCLDKQEVLITSLIQGEKIIGINLSTLILENCYTSDKELILNAYRKLIQYILEKTEYKILFIPHVMQGADLKILKIFYKEFKESNRVEIIDNETLSSSELKYIISKCEIFVGARTHATIAAYSSCVPTLVLGYSVKSIGIATDLFGTSNGYVIPVQKIENEEELLEHFKKILENKTEIKKHLEQVMPAYIEQAFSIGSLINNLFFDEGN